MTGITRRFAILLGLIPLVPKSSQADGRDKQQQRLRQVRCGQCTASGTVIDVGMRNFFASEYTIQITITPYKGSPQNFTPEAFSDLVSAYVIDNSGPNGSDICNLSLRQGAAPGRRRRGNAPSG